MKDHTNLHALQTEKNQLQQQLTALQHAYVALEQKMRRQTTELQRTTEFLQQEIAEHRQAEAQLRFKARLLDEGGHGVIAISPDGTIVYCNHAAATFSGWKEAELIGRDVLDLAFDSNWVERGRQIMDQVCSGEPWSGEFLVRRRDGTRLSTLVTDTPLFDDHGQVSTIVATFFDYSMTFTDITERKQMEHMLHQRVCELTALRTTMNEITSELELTALLHMILQRSTDLLQANSGQLALYDAHMNDLQILACINIDPDIIGTHQPLTEGATRQVVQTRRPLIIHNYQTWKHRLPQYRQSDAHTLLLVPLLAGDQLIGIISIGDDNPDRIFCESDVQLLTLFAQQSTIAIQNARLFELAQRRATESETLRRASAAVAATLHQDQAISAILDQLGQVVPHDSAAVQLIQGDQSVIVGGRGFPDPHAVIGMSFSLKEHPLASRLYHNRMPLLLADIREFNHDLDESVCGPIRAWLGVPLIIRDEIIGWLTLDSWQVNYFTRDHLRLVTAFADQVAVALDNTRLFTEVQHLATTDPLTGLCNRRSFFEKADYELNQAWRYQRQVSIMMLDIDHFKRLNDTYGHIIGDQVLQATAEQCRKLLRVVDIIGRYGGEEIVVLLPETDLEGAYQAAERLCRHMAQTPVVTSTGRIYITVTIGVATYSGKGHMSLDKLIDQADQALYHAKQTGRNQVMTWLDVQTTPQSVSVTRQVLPATILTERYDQVYHQFLAKLLHGLDLRDRVTARHTRRIVSPTLQLARRLGIPTADLEHVRSGAILHDVGKLLLPDAILHKPGPLSDREWQLMRRHPLYAYELLAHIGFLHAALDIPHYHHERWNGSGYPRGLKGTDIPLMARLFAVVDVWYALCSDRPYRPAWTDMQATTYLRTQSGVLFDPMVVTMFIEMLV